MERYRRDRKRGDIKRENVLYISRETKTRKRDRWEKKDRERRYETCMYSIDI